MKKMICGGVLALGLAFAGSANAASIIVGEKDDGNCYPFLCNDSGTDSGQSIDYQQVFSATAFPSTINITSLTYYFANEFGLDSVMLTGTYNFYFSYAANGVGSLSDTLSDNVAGTQSLFASIGGGVDVDPTLTVTGTPFLYDPSLGDLLLEIVVTDQENVPNSGIKDYQWADYTGLVTTRAYCVTGIPCEGDTVGALRTGFNVTATTPEPATLALFGAGLLGIGRLRRRRR